MQGLGKVPPFLVKKVPVVVVFNSMIPQYRTLITTEIRASVLEDMKSRRAITTSYQLFAYTSSTLLVNCSKATWGLGYCSLYDHSMAPYRSRTHERPGSSGQTSLVAATYQSVRFSRSLATRFLAEQPYLFTRVCPLKWVGGKRACTMVAGTQDIALGYQRARASMPVQAIGVFVSYVTATG